MLGVCKKIMNLLFSCVLLGLSQPMECTLIIDHLLVQVPMKSSCIATPFFPLKIWKRKIDG